MTQRVENASLADSKLLLNTVVQVPYGSDLDALMPRLVAAVPRLMADPAPVVQLTNFAPDGLALTFGFWVCDPENGQGNLRCDFNLAFLRTPNERGDSTGRGRLSARNGHWWRARLDPLS